MSRPSAATARSETSRAARLLWRLLPAAVAVSWVGLLLVTPTWRAPAPGGAAALTAAVVDLAAARICHRQPQRSFHVDEGPLPVCGRCTGLYVSGAVGLLAASVAGGRRAVGALSRGAVTPAPDRRTLLLVAAGMPTLVTWGLELAGVWDPGTPVRAVAALPLGLAVGWVVGRALAGSRVGH